MERVWQTPLAFADHHLRLKRSIQRRCESVRKECTSRILLLVIKITSREETKRRTSAHQSQTAEPCARHRSRGVIDMLLRWVEIGAQIGVEYSATRVFQLPPNPSLPPFPNSVPSGSLMIYSAFKSHSPYRCILLG